MNNDIKVTFDSEEDVKTSIDGGSIQYGQLEIGETITGKTGEAAKVTNSGSLAHAILNFTLPRGDKGEKGDKGDKGDTPDLTPYATKEYVDEEIATFDFIKVVEELPETGLENRVYLVPKADTQTQDLFDEYVWFNGAWEWITTKQIEVDLTPYAKKSDLPPNEIAISPTEPTTGEEVWLDDTNKEIYVKNDNGTYDLFGKTEKKFCVASLSSSSTLTFTSQWEKIRIPFNKIEGKLGDFSLENGGIKIGKNISRIKVTVNVSVADITKEGMYSLVTRRGEVSRAFSYFRLRGFDTLTYTYILNVNENDNINVVFQNQETFGNDISLYGNSSYATTIMIIESID